MSTHRTKAAHNTNPSHLTGSVTSRKVKELKRAVLDASSKRERLPQPLFWSLFRSRLSDIKRAKERTRLLRNLLDGVSGE